MKIPISEPAERSLVDVTSAEAVARIWSEAREAVRRDAPAIAGRRQRASCWRQTRAAVTGGGSQVVVGTGGAVARRE